MLIDSRVAPFLGRVLDDAGEPVGTCFQLRSGVLVTAWHVLDALGAAEEGARVQFDPLQGGQVREAQVRRVDSLHDIAVLAASEPLAAYASGLARSDQVPAGTPIVITGVATVDDPGHSYRHLDADGRWAGGASRDEQVLLGRVVADAVMRGMSGAPVLAGQMVIGVVSARYNSADGWGRDSVWVARTEDLAPLLAEPGTAPGQLLAYPFALTSTSADLAGPALSLDVQENYQSVLQASALSLGLPVHWTLDELSRMLQKARAEGLESSKVADALTALCEALEAKAVFLALGGSGLALAQLQVTYRREIGAWPDGNSADALLVEAASAGIAERRSRSSRQLGALARFLAAVAAALGVAPQETELMVQWAGSLGHQPADLRAYYARCLDNVTWLVIDLGDEPQYGADPWPTTVAWTQLTKDGAVASDRAMCEPTADGLKRALRDILLVAPPARRLVVDLAVPRALMDAGIERWPLLEVDDGLEPLVLHCSPRLRWSRRRRDMRLQYRLLDRVERASWEGSVRHWLRNDPGHACFLGGHDAQAHTDPLRVALREGCGFIIWFPNGMPTSAIRRISKVVSAVPVPARRDSLPDQLPGFRQSHPAVIWDDPQGRSGLQLPPLAVPESP